MSNTNLTVSMITKEALRVAHEKAVFIGTLPRTYDDQYAKGGGKIGSALQIRKPNQFTRRQGSAVMQVQDVTQRSSTLTVATQDGVDMRFGMAELALDIDEFSKLYIQPAMQSLVSGIDGDVLQGCTKKVYNQTGAAGTIVGSSSGSIVEIHNARAKLNQYLAPKDGRKFMLDSVTMAAIANGNKGLFLPENQVNKAFTEGYFGRAAGADWYENERVLAHVVGGDITCQAAANAGITDGGGSGDTCTITWDGGNVATLLAGDVFTLPKVYMCHPESKQSSGQLQQFVVITPTSTTSTVISPRVYWSGPFQNVCNATGGASVAADFNDEVPTFTGSVNTSYQQNLMYHPEAFAFATADLPLMANEEKCVRMNADGLALRVWQGPDIINDQMLTRIDILYGYQVLRPEWACRITN